MTHIAICIITCRRPHGLIKLLDSLNDMDMAGLDRVRLSIVVVDNDPGKTAGGIIEELAPTFRFPPHYHHEAEPGIPFARNRCIREAMDIKADFLVFLDDDEMVEAGWLSEMLKIQSDYHADIVWGPVFPVFEAEPPQWMKDGGFYDRQRYADGEKLTAAASNNVLMRMAVVADGGLRFNEAMRHTGGTDHLFFSQAAKQGFTIHWAEKAVVWEDIPASRITESWLCRRYLRFGNTHTLTEMALYPGGKTMVKIMVQGTARLGLGTAAYPLTPFVNKVKAMKIKRAFYRGAGMLSALFQLNYQEYKH